MPKHYKIYDVADYLKTPEDIAAYIEDFMEDGDPALLLVALGDVIRASHNISTLSRDSGVSRETLYKALSREGNPRYSSLIAVLQSLGLELSVRPRQVA